MVAPLKPNQRDAARVELAARQPDRFQRERRAPPPAAVSAAVRRRPAVADRVVDHRALAADELERQPHPFEQRQDVGEDDRGVEVELR